MNQQLKLTSIDEPKKVKETKITDHMPRIIPQKKVKPAKKSADSTTPSTFPVTTITPKTPVLLSEATPLQPLHSSGIYCVNLEIKIECRTEYIIKIFLMTFLLCCL